MEFTGTINVGGINYTFDKKKAGVNYLFRNYDQFKITFQSVAERSGISLSEIERLFITHFCVKPFDIQDFTDIKKEDKDKLEIIFKAYLKQLEISKEISGNSVISIMLNRTYYEISKILMELNGEPESFSNKSVTCQASKKKLHDLDDTIRAQMILEFTWLLKNPEMIDSVASCKWADAVAELTETRISEVPKNLNNQKSLKGGGSNHDIQSRCKSLLIVSIILSAAKKHGYDNEEDCQELQQSFSKAIASLFTHVKSTYQPVYKVIENCMKRNHVKKKKIIMPLLQLQHLSNHFIGSRKEAYGIYRIRNAGKRLVTYLSSQLQCISSTLDKMKPAARRKYHDVQKELSPISPISLPKRKAVASSKKGVILPVVQFVTLDGNLTIPPYEQFYRKGSESEKEQFYQVMTDFFTKDNIYMIYSQSDEVPLNFYDISLPSIDTADSHIPVTDYHSKRIIQNHVLQDFCTFVDHATYTNAELVLSIFIALKEKRTK